MNCERILASHLLRRCIGEQPFVPLKYNETKLYAFLRDV
jgi:hypothetical protein